ncbi:MAG: Clo7bot family Cys-rich peptide [Lachnospiraceae bacterium]|nr:Clo7bot family Cys-rich peptide [Lachnospiraceae bacterium]
MRYIVNNKKEYTVGFCVSAYCDHCGRKCGSDCNYCSSVR